MEWPQPLSAPLSHVNPYSLLTRSANPLVRKHKTRKKKKGRSVHEAPECVGIVWPTVFTAAPEPAPELPNLFLNLLNSRILLKLWIQM